MNTTSQPDLHPDAECLNAFVEQVLAGPERERILSHIASCSRCRQVVYLAQEAASGAETPAASPVLHPAKQPVFWASWRFAWVPAVALAAIVTLAIFLHRPQSVPNTEFARVAPRAEGAIPMPPAQNPVGTKAAQSPGAAILAARYTSSAPARTDSKKLPPAAASSVALPAAAGAAEPLAAESQAAVMPSGASEERLSTQEAAVQLKSETVDAARQSQFANGALASNTTTAKISPVRMKSVAGTDQAIHGQPVAASASRLEMKEVPTGSFNRASQPSMAGVLAPGTSSLPSGLGAVSTATAQHRTISIDLAGTLFLSDDAGKHWEPVVQQWTGRAVEVRAKSALSSPPAALFEIVNDRGQVWASADGRTWKAN